MNFRIGSAVVLAVVNSVGCGDDGGDEAGTMNATTGVSPSTGAGPTGSSTEPTSTGSQSGSEASTDPETDTRADDSSTTEVSPPVECWDDLPVGQTEVFYDGFAEGSEGIAFGVDGALYVTTIEDTDGVVWRLDAEAQIEMFAELPYALGLAPTMDGGWVVASLGEIMMPDGGVYTVSPAGEASLLAEGIDSPNFVTIAPDGSALISDDFDTRVFRVQLDGTVSTVIENVPSPNGMAYSPSGDALYVASTFTSAGQLTRFDVDDAGLPIESTAVEILHTGAGSIPDGIAVDLDGNVYVAANLAGEIWRIDGALQELGDGEVFASELDSPASLAFGAGEGFDPCSLYITELFGTQVVRLSVGVGGAPLYR